MERLDYTWLTSSPDIDAISLTGSVESGAEIAKNAAPHMKRVFLEGMSHSLDEMTVLKTIVLKMC
jgi:acyl-CoA reductase-like NAD-dependent aldehyde dehydrogenase